MALGSLAPIRAAPVQAGSGYERSFHVSGTLLRQLCKSDEPGDARQCESYVVGVADGLQSADLVLNVRGRPAIFFCPIRTFTPAEATAIVRSYLASASDAEIRGSAGAKIIASGFAERYPCPVPRSR